MRKKVLFTHSYFMRFDPKQWAWKQPYPPLATILAAAVLREMGYDVQLFDTMFAHGPDEVKPIIERFKPDYFIIYDDGFNYLTKMCLTNMREAACSMANIANQSGCKVIASGSDSTDHTEKYLNNGVDFVIQGEAEETLTELLSALDNNATNFETIAGLSYKADEGNVYKTQARTLLKNLDELPLPAWDLVDVDSYKKVWLSRWDYFSLNIATTRGCPYKCNWCAKPIYGNAYNMRSAKNVVAELKMLQEKYGYNHIWFCDDIFGLRRNWVIEFTELVGKEGLQLRYKIQSRADLLVQEKYVEALANSGCESVWMGAESGSQKILDAMDKGTTIEQIKQSTRLLKQYGIKPAFFLQLGYPGETMQDIESTINLLNECLPDDIGISVSYPLPGTSFYEKVKSELKTKSNWTDSDELALMFKSTYSPQFYKQLHRYIHKQYRMQQAYEGWQNLFTNPMQTNLATLKRAASVAYYVPATIIAKQKLKHIEHAASGF